MFSSKNMAELKKSDPEAEQTRWMQEVGFTKPLCPNQYRFSNTVSCQEIWFTVRPWLKMLYSLEGSLVLPQSEMTFGNSSRGESFFRLTDDVALLGMISVAHKREDAPPRQPHAASMHHGTFLLCDEQAWRWLVEVWWLFVHSKHQSSLI